MGMSNAQIKIEFTDRLGNIESSVVSVSCGSAHDGQAVLDLDEEHGMLCLMLGGVKSVTVTGKDLTVNKREG